MTTAAAVVARLGLLAHPEGGHYREIYRDQPEGGGRGACTAIHYLLAAGERSHWHKVDAVEVWSFHAGGPLRLRLAAEGGPVRTVILGADLAAGQLPQAVVPAGVWQAAEPLGAWTLVGCVVAPAFTFAGFTLAPQGWKPTSSGDIPEEPA